MRYTASSIAAASILGACVTLSACSTTTPTACDQACVVNKAYMTAESSVTIAAKGITKAVQAGAIVPGSSTAKAVQLGLDGASKALDAANAYIAAGNMTAAQAQVDAANSQVATVNSQTGAQP